MKKFIFIASFTFIFLATGCLDNYIPIEEYNNEVALYESQLEEANSETKAKSIEILELKEEAKTLENDLDLTEEELIKYKSLINNLNELLSNVYYMECENSGYTNWGTGFSINYQNKYFILTAGHYVKNKYGKFGNFRFKANFSDKWIYPKLLVYNNDYLNRNDYAIFYSDKISNGFIIDNENDNPEYILGTENQNLNIIRNFNINGIEGESGSPIVDYEGEISGINTTDIPGYFTKIYTIIEAIDKIN